jgi:XTP/dITP diphosphohydrolase
MTLYVLTANPYKIKEAEYYASWRGIREKHGVDLCFVKHDVQEILHFDITAIVRRKAVEAYAFIRHPCVVEHGGLFMTALPGLPGGVGKVIWDAVGDRMCSFLREGDSRAAISRSFLGYCDGRRVRVYTGETPGEVTERARGDYAFAWDQIFRPEGSEQTYGEIGLERKAPTSPLSKAWDKLLSAESAGMRSLMD